MCKTLFNVTLDTEDFDDVEYSSMNKIKTIKKCNQETNVQTGKINFKFSTKINNLIDKNKCHDSIVINFRKLASCDCHCERFVWASCVDDAVETPSEICDAGETIQTSC